MTGPAFDPAGLEAFGAALLAWGGLDAEKARLTAHLLVEADMLGRSTHGLLLCPTYVAALRAGRLAGTGEPEVASDRGAAVVWDGRALPGLWLGARAIDLACDRARLHGLATVLIRRAGHLGCLAVLVKRAAERGLVAIVTSSNPTDAHVAPHGGARAALSTDPFAVGFPAGDHPVLIDISASVTSGSTVERHYREGRQLPEPWLVDAEGRPTADPAAFMEAPRGALLPLGGLSHGHKGTAIALMIEALTQGLSGFGRSGAEPGTRHMAAFVLVIDPEHHAGLDAFEREAGHLAEAVRTTPPAPGTDRVRVPGDRAYDHYRRARAEGVRLHPEVLPALQPLAAEAGIAMPVP